MKPAIVYAAKSTVDIHASIPAQLKEGRTDAEAAGWTVVGEFKDENKSAFTGNRGDDLAKTQKLAEELAAIHGECGLFIQHSDRLARGDGIQAAHLVEYALWAIKSGVKIISKQDPQTFADLLYAVVTGQRNHEDSKRKSEGTRKGIREKAEAGGATGGGRRRFGYRWAEDKSGRLLVVRFEAQVIEHRMYRAILAGVSGLQIMRELEADGIKTVTGARWHGATISQILHNPFYKGVVVYEGEEYQGIHEAIIEPDLWQEVADYLALNKNAGRPQGQGRTPSGKHLFRKGMLSCICGGSMVPRTVRRKLATGKVASYEHYECYEHHRDSSSCPVTAIRRELIDSPVFRYFERVGIDLKATKAQLVASQRDRVDQVRSLLNQAEGDAQHARAALERVERDYLAGAIDAADWNRFSGNLREELGAAESQVARLAAQSEEIEREDAGRDLAASVLEKLAAIRASIAGEVSDASGAEAARAAIQRLFEGFALHEPELGLEVPSELAWIDRFVLLPRIRQGAIPDGILPLTAVDGPGTPDPGSEPSESIDENRNVTVVT